MLGGSSSTFHQLIWLAVGFPMSPDSTEWKKKHQTNCEKGAWSFNYKSPQTGLNSLNKYIRWDSSAMWKPTSSNEWNFNCQDDLRIMFVLTKTQRWKANLKSGYVPDLSQKICRWGGNSIRLPLCLSYSVCLMSPKPGSLPPCRRFFSRESPDPDISSRRTQSQPLEKVFGSLTSTIVWFEHPGGLEEDKALR
jgi:hypothetical protein